MGVGVAKLHLHVLQARKNVLKQHSAFGITYWDPLFCAGRQGALGGVTG